MYEYLGVFVPLSILAIVLYNKCVLLRVSIDQKSGITWHG